MSDGGGGREGRAPSRKPRIGNQRNRVGNQRNRIGNHQETNRKPRDKRIGNQQNASRKPSLESETNGKRFGNHKRTESETNKTRIGNPWPDSETSRGRIGNSSETLKLRVAQEPQVPNYPTTQVPNFSTPKLRNSPASPTTPTSQPTDSPTRVSQHDAWTLKKVWCISQDDPPPRLQKSCRSPGMVKPGATLGH